MKINQELLKQIRDEGGLTQEEMAEKLHMSVRNYQRMEKDGNTIDMWRFIEIMELLGKRSEDYWMMFLETEEYKGYDAYKQLKKTLSNEDVREATGLIKEIESKPLIERPFIKQFIMYAKVVIANELMPKQAIEKLVETIQISIKEFDEDKISEYKLTYNEIFILGSMSAHLFEMGEHDRAIAISKTIIENKDNIRVTDIDKSHTLPWLMSGLAWKLGNANRHKEALKTCKDAISISHEYGKFGNIPELTYYMAISHYKLGEEEAIWKTCLVRAYHCAHAMGKSELAKINNHHPLRGLLKKSRIQLGFWTFLLKNVIIEL